MMVHAPRRWLLLLPLALAAAVPRGGARADRPEDGLVLRLRTRVETFKGSGVWDEAAVARTLDGRATALLLCDMWDDHWCKKAAARCDALARKMPPVLAAARARGVVVLHAPSECVGFYADHPARKRALAVPRVEPPKALDLPDPPCPVDAADGGCDDDRPVKPFRAWKRQHAAIPIADEDYVSDSGPEVYSILRACGVKNLLVCGVHTNMCVLHRSFAIKQMTRWGVRCVLLRDLTDALYNPQREPFVSHEEGTERVVQFIERHWCPSALSADLLMR